MSDHQGELILYPTEDGRAELHLRAAGDTVWLTQAEMTELFDTTPQNITQHIRSVYKKAELTEEATCKDDLQVRSEGGREVRRTVKLYRLEPILAVGFRVRSPRGALLLPRSRAVHSRRGIPRASHEKAPGLFQ
ncbi:MAG: hypothetical protein E6Q50_12480 [Lysobacter sp.]|nr:MAG: hypothetical protein E6Q50_12480 [Lysobacter sp.]